MMHMAHQQTVSSKETNALRDALIAVEAHGADRQSSNYRINLGFVLLMLGLLDGAEESFRVALEHTSRLGLVQPQSAARHHLGVIARIRGRRDEALALQRETSLSIGADRRLATATGVQMARMHVERGNLDQADEAIARFDEAGLPPDIASQLLCARAI